MLLSFKEFLNESVSRYNEIVKLSNFIINQLTDSITTNLSKALDERGNNYKFRSNTIKIKSVPDLSNETNTFLSTHKDGLIVSVLPFIPGFDKAQYAPKEHILNVYINTSQIDSLSPLLLTYSIEHKENEDDVIIDLDQDTIDKNVSTFKNKLNDILSSYKEDIVHELTHAVEFFLSNGKIVSQEDLDVYKQMYKQNNKITHQKYLNIPTERNANFYATLSKLDMNQDIQTVIKQFKNTFEGWNTFDKNVQERLLKRLSQHYYE